jgi:F-type H+-transporting ATPase subunit delta
MFTPERWAAAFINTAGDEAPIGEGLDLLRALSPVISAIPGSVAGTDAVVRLEKMIRQSLSVTKTAGNSAGSVEAKGVQGRGTEIALRFLLLLIKKDLFRHIDAIIKEIEAELDRLRGILPVTLESAAAPDGDFQESLRKQLIEKTGAKGIKLDTRLVPDLLGGYRLRIGGDIIDASLRSQLQRMGAELAGTASADAGAAPHGGF